MYRCAATVMRQGIRGPRNQLHLLLIIYTKLEQRRESFGQLPHFHDFVGKVPMAALSGSIAGLLGLGV